MSNFSFLEGENVQRLIDEILETLIRQYRVERIQARKNIEDVFITSKSLQKVFEKELVPDKIKRTRAFKDALAAIKRTTYFGLRRYHADTNNQLELIKKLEDSTASSHEEIQRLAETLAGSHASTKERIQNAEEFYQRLLKIIDTPRTILDVGCGMQPLLFPFDAMGKDFKLYLAADKDPTSISALSAFAQAGEEKRLQAVKWDIQEGWETLLSYNNQDEFDVAFLFKVVPVIERQNPEFLSVLRKSPAKIWIVTGSKISLTKNKSIERRERATLRRFIELTQRRVVAEFSVGEEFGFVLEKS